MAIESGDRPCLLGEQVISSHGSFSRVRRYYKGWHPHLGVLCQGWSGKETIVERDIIRAVKILQPEKPPPVKAVVKESAKTDILT